MQKVNEEAVHLLILARTLNMRRDIARAHRVHIPRLSGAVPTQEPQLCDQDKADQLAQDISLLYLPGGVLDAGAQRLDHIGVHGGPLPLRVQALHRRQILYAATRQLCHYMPLHTRIYLLDTAVL